MLGAKQLRHLRSMNTRLAPDNFARHGLHTRSSLPPHSSALPPLAEATPEFSTELKSVAAIPEPESHELSSTAVEMPAADELQERASEPEGLLQGDFLFMLPVAMFVLLGSFAAIIALT